MPLFSRYKQRLGLLVLSILGAFLLLASVSLQDNQELFIHLQVRARQETRLEFFGAQGQGVGTGAGLQAARLIGGDFLQGLRFALPCSRFKTLRLDFSPPADHLAVHKVWITDKRNLPLVRVGLAALRPLHDVRVVKQEGEVVAFSSEGGEPQIQIAVAWWQVRFGTIRPGAVVALVMLIYPLLAGVFAALGRRNRIGAGGLGSLLKNDPLVVAGLICWCFAAVQALQPRSIRLEETVINQKAVRYPRPVAGEPVWLARSDGLPIAGQLYGGQGTGRYRGVMLLLHGNYPEGQQFPLYPVLAQELGARGYLVLTIDFAGFGASADPFATHQSHRVDLELETEAALAYLAGIAPEHKRRIGLVGHSMGADPALRVGLRSSLVGSITLMGPPRRVWERFHAMSDIGFFWNWAIEVGRKQYKRNGFPTWYGKEQWRQDILRRDMALMLPALEDGGHKPVLFVDGGREPDLDREFLDEYVRRVRYPKRYVTLNGVDHNSNVRRQGAHILYEPAVMEKTVGVLDDWHQAYASGRPTPFDIGRNLLRLLFSGLPVIGGR